MNRELYTEKFVAYANSFLTEDEDHNYHIILKREHTLRVAKLCDNIIENENEEAIGEEPLPYLVGLFHDIGRFEQFKQYQSFHDGATVDHGLLGKKILESEHLLAGLSAPHKELLQYTTLHHNKLAIPESKDMLEFYTRLVRDADKLDIYHVLQEHLNPGEGNSRLNIHLPDTDGYSEDILEDIFEGRLVCYTKRKNYNDMKLTMLSWIQDLHFNYSYKHVLDKNYITIFCHSLPQTSQIEELRNFLILFCRQKAETSS